MPSPLLQPGQPAWLEATVTNDQLSFRVVQSPDAQESMGLGKQISAHYLFQSEETTGVSVQEERTGVLRPFWVKPERGRCTRRTKL